MWSLSDVLRREVKHKRKLILQKEQELRHVDFRNRE